MSGVGKLVWPDNRIYEGEFLNDKKHGKGKLTTAEGRIIDGKWKNGKYVKKSSSNVDKEQQSLINQSLLFLVKVKTNF